MSKSSDLHFEYTRGCLIVRATGRGLVDSKEATTKAIAAAIKAKPVKAVLIDMRDVTGRCTFMDRYQLGELVGRYLTQVPIGALANDSQVDPRRIGQVVANNRGAKMEVFTDPIAAQDWLKKFSTVAEETPEAPASQTAEFIKV